MRSQTAIKPAAHAEVVQKDTLQKGQNEVFFCPEESHFYSYCLERLVFNQCTHADVVIEFGCGDGSPVIHSLSRTRFNGTVYGYELNPAACEVAHSRIRQGRLEEKYIVRNQSFFDATDLDAQYLIANPPYIPAPDNDIYLPALHGGVDGATVTNRLLSLQYPAAMLLVSSYSNPVGTIEHAIAQGYAVVDFMVTPLPFGYYSSQKKVRDHIAEMRERNQAFYSNNIYFLAGVLFAQKAIAEVDLSEELIQVMTSL